MDIFDPLDANSKEVNYDVEVTTLSTILDAMEQGDVSKYSRFNRLLYDHPELVEHFDWQWLHQMRSTWSSGKTYQVFIGGKGTERPCTALRAQPVHPSSREKTLVLHRTQGRPMVEPSCLADPYFYSMFDPECPDYASYPGMAATQIWECTPELGDVLFNPPFWWHQVRNITPSIGVGFRWFDLVDNLATNATGTVDVDGHQATHLDSHQTQNNFAAIFKHMQSKS